MRLPRVLDVDVLRPLANGGMAELWVGKHRGRIVAVKVVRESLAQDARAVERFLYEIEVAQSLHHPNLVQILAAGRADDGRPYLVMPLLEGCDCLEFVSIEGRRSANDVAEVLRGAACGLDAMHAVGLAHRDIKPDNIFVEMRHHRSVMLDFGLAALLEEGTNLTDEGEVLGTPEYLPPECVRGQKAGVAADVYSLALVAYEMIAGAHPFEAATAVEVLTKKMMSDAPLLSTYTGQVHPELDALFHAALAREPDRRPKSCTQFVVRLAREGGAGEASDRSSRHSHTPSPCREG